MKGVSEYLASAILLVITAARFGLVYTLISNYTDVVEKLSGVKSIRVEVIGCRGNYTYLYNYGDVIRLTNYVEVYDPTTGEWIASQTVGSDTVFRVNGCSHYIVLETRDGGSEVIS